MSTGLLLPGDAGLLLAGTAVLAAVMAVLWLVQTRTKDAGVVDVGWSAGMGFLAVLLATGGGGDPWRRALLAVMAGGWSLRLAAYLLVDRVLRGSEDGRYAMLRARWGSRAQPLMLGFFLAQALVAGLLAVPFAVVTSNARPLGWLDAAGVVTWIVAVAGESLADRQLARFRSRPENAGRTCREGLWAWSRHPNYFFEWLHWFAYLPLALGASPWWPVLLGPAVMLVLLRRVTGIPYAELQAVKSRGDDYRRYQKEVPAFVPRPPRRSRA